MERLYVALTALAVSMPAFYFLRKASARSQRRDRHLKQSTERVLVLGASSGVGRAVAKQYAARGARVCVVARRAGEISALAEECGNGCIWVVADFSNAEDMVALRGRLEAEWQGLDTIHICAGVSALQPVMALTGTQSASEDAGAAGIQNALDIAGRAVQGNFNGPFVSALAFVGLISNHLICLETNLTYPSDPNVDTDIAIAINPAGLVSGCDHTCAYKSTVCSHESLVPTALSVSSNRAPPNRLHFHPPRYHRGQLPGLRGRCRSRAGGRSKQTRVEDRLCCEEMY